MLSAAEAAPVALYSNNEDGSTSVMGYVNGPVRSMPEPNTPSYHHRPIHPAEVDHAVLKHKRPQAYKLNFNHRAAGATCPNPYQC